MLIKSVLSWKTSPYWEYKCNMERKWTKRIIINNGWNFHSHGRAWMNLFSVRTSPHTSTKTTTKLHSGRLLSWISFHSFPSPVYFNHCIYQHLSGSFYLGESRNVIMMWCPKIEVYFEYSWTFDQYPIKKKSNSFPCICEMRLFIWEPLQTKQTDWILK